MIITCDYCGKTIERPPSKIKRHNFCSRSCLGAFSSKTMNPKGYTELKDLSGVSQHMTELNRKLNPTRMTDEVRKKLSDVRYGRGNRTEYRKRNGKHEHRAVAEAMLGRKLRSGEVVHHIDGDKKNNNPNNLMVFESQAEHARHHSRKQKEVSQ